MLNVVLNTVSHSPKPRLCQQYWKRTLASHQAEAGKSERVSYHSGLVTLNKYLNGLKSYIRNGGQRLPINHPFKGTVNELMKQTDTEFKQLKPNATRMVLTRGLNKVDNPNSPEYQLLQLHKQAKKGERIRLKGYAYAAPKVEGNPYTDNPYVSIIYDMEIPEKARLSQLNGEFIFPRSSEFEVTDNIDLGNGVNNIKMRYILPEN